MAALTGTEIDALHEALDDEYRAWATYDRVIADFGEAPPFSHIREAEARHIDALRNLFARYGLPIPENPWPGRVPRYGSMQEACSAGAGVARAAEKQRQRNSGRLRHATLLPSLIAGTGPLLPGQTNEQHDTAPHHPVRQLPRH